MIGIIIGSTYQCKEMRSTPHVDLVPTRVLIFTLAPFKNESLQFSYSAELFFLSSHFLTLANFILQLTLHRPPGVTMTPSFKFCPIYNVIIGIFLFPFMTLFSTLSAISSAYPTKKNRIILKLFEKKVVRVAKTPRKLTETQ